MTADLSALIARLEAAEVGSRELDVAIARSLGWGVHNSRRFGLWVVPFGEYDTCDPDDMFELGAFTASLDAALALAERVGWRVYSIDMSIIGRASVMLQSIDDLHGTDPETGAYMIGKDFSWGSGKTPALALCIATLRAKEAP